MDLKQQLQAVEWRALEAEKKLKEAEYQIQVIEEKANTAEHRALLAEERAVHAEQATKVARKRIDLVEEHVLELERKLYTTENDMEELLARDTERLGLGSNSNSKSGSLNSHNSLTGFFVAQDQQHGVCEERHSVCGAECTTTDTLSITSL